MMPIPLNEKVLQKDALMGKIGVDFESGEVGLLD